MNHCNLLQRTPIILVLLERQRKICFTTTIILESVAKFQSLSNRRLGFSGAVAHFTWKKYINDAFF